MVNSTNKLTATDGNLRWLDFLWLPFLLVPVLLFPSWGELATYDLDEGYNLVRASLVLDGHNLYTEIWHDQPPLMTYLLAGLFAITGKSVMAARILMAAFGLLATCSFYLVVRHVHGRAVAFIAVVLLTCSAFYIRLNISVMETIPSMALAFAAMACCCRPRWRPGWTEAAGVLSALALQVKLNTALFIPLTLVLLLVPAGGPKRLTRFLAWVLPFAAVTALFVIGLYGEGATRMLTIHWAATDLQRFQYLDGMTAVPRLLAADKLLMLLAGIGLVVNMQPLRKHLWVPLTWMVGWVAIFLFHRPVWYHYYVLLAPALCWIAALGVVVLGRVPRRGKPAQPRWVTPEFWYAVCGVVLAMALLGGYSARNVRHLRRARLTHPPAFSGAIQHQNGQPATAITIDRQFLAFTTGLKVPPPYAVTSWKREALGELSPAQFEKDLETYRPEYVILARGNDSNPALIKPLSGGYILLEETEQTHLFVRKEPATP